MPRLLSDSESDSDQNRRQLSNSSCFPFGTMPNMFHMFQQCPPTNHQWLPMSSSLQMPAMPMVIPQNFMGNMMPAMPENMDDPNKVFFLVMPVTARDLMNHYASFNQNVFPRSNQSTSSFQTSNQFCFARAPETLKIKDSKKSKSTRSKRTDDLIIIDKVPVIRLERVDSNPIQKKTSSLSLNNMLVPRVNLQRIEKPVTPVKNSSWVGKCCRCKKTFDKLLTLQLHAKQKHPRLTMFFCEVCGRSFLLRKFWEKHKLEHRSEGSATKKADRENSVVSTSTNSSRSSSPALAPPVAPPRRKPAPRNLFSVSVKKPEDAIAKKPIKEASKFRRRSKRNSTKSSVDNSGVSPADSTLIVSVTKVIKKPRESATEKVVSNGKNQSVKTDVYESLISDLERVSKRSKKVPERRKAEPETPVVLSRLRPKTRRKNYHKIANSFSTPESEDLSGSNSFIHNFPRKRRRISSGSENYTPVSDSESNLSNEAEKNNRVSENKESSVEKNGEVKDTKRKRGREPPAEKKLKLETVTEKLPNDLCEKCTEIRDTIQVIVEKTSLSEQNSTKLKCPTCTKYFRTVAKLQLHLSSSHSICKSKPKCDIIFEESQKKDVKEVTSPQSDEEFAPQDSPKIVESADQTSNPEKQSSIYQCTRCQIEFSGNDDYFAHYLDSHSTVKDVPVEVSRERFVELLEDKQIEDQIDLISCSVCKIKYNGKVDLSRHHSIAHTEFSNMCSICGMSYKTKNEILEHVLTHGENSVHIVDYELKHITKIAEATVNSNHVDLDSTRSLDDANSDWDMTNGNPQVNSDDLQNADTFVLKRKSTEGGDAPSPKIMKMSESSNSFCKSCEKSFDSEKLYNEHAYYIHDEVFEHSKDEMIRPQNDVLLPSNDTFDPEAVTSVVKELLETVASNEERQEDVSMKIVPDKIVGISSMVEELENKEDDFSEDETKSEKSDEKIEMEVKMAAVRTYRGRQRKRRGRPKKIVKKVDKSFEVNKKACKETVPRCLVCFQDFSSQDKLNLHQFFVHQDQRFVHICENCNVVLATIENVNEHVCKGRENFYCSTCDVGFESSLLLKEHNNEKHLETEGLHLCHCGKEFLTIRMLMRHIGLVHNEEQSEGVMNPYNGTICEEGEDVMAVHIIPIDNQGMDIDDQVTELAKFIKLDEYKEAHAQIVSSSTPRKKVGTKTFCPHCKSSFCNINDHLTKKHSLYGDICKLCGLVYQKVRAVEHFLDHHIHPSPNRVRDINEKLNSYRNTLDLVEFLKPVCLVSVFLYRLQDSWFNNQKDVQCLSCDERFTNHTDYQKHFVQTHDKVCVLCNQVFTTASLAANHKLRKHRSLDVYLWFVNNAFDFFASVVDADDFTSFERCLCKVLAISHQKKSTETECERQTDISHVCRLMTECVEDFGQNKSDNKSVLLVLNEDIVKYKDNVGELAASMITNISQLSLQELTELLKNYVRSLD